MTISKTRRPDIDSNVIVAKYSMGISAMSIAKEFNISEHMVNYRLKKAGITKRSLSKAHQQYTLNENYFDTVDTHEKAYWLGFLYADGYNHEGRGDIKLCLNVNDIPHLERFNKALNSNRPIKQNAGNLRDNTAQLDINNKHFSASLAKLGCVQNKSFVINMPNFDVVPERFRNSFMLGYFDGDGCICASGNMFSITSCFDFLTTYQQVLMDNCDLNQTKLSTKKKTAHKPLREKSWRLAYSGRNSITRIYNFLYSANIYSLPRKKLKFQSLIKPEVVIATKPTLD